MRPCPGRAAAALASLVSDDVVGVALKTGCFSFSKTNAFPGRVLSCQGMGAADPGGVQELWGVALGDLDMVELGSGWA